MRRRPVPDRTLGIAGQLAGQMSVRDPHRGSNPAPAFVEMAFEAILEAEPKPAGSVLVPYGGDVDLAATSCSDRLRLRQLAAAAKRAHAPCVTGGIADRREVKGRFSAPDRSELNRLVESVRVAQDLLPVPLAVQHGDRPGTTASLPCLEFLTELADRTGCWLVVDLTGLQARCLAEGRSFRDALNDLPTERIAYVKADDAVFTGPALRTLEQLHAGGLPVAFTSVEAMTRFEDQRRSLATA